MTKIELVRFNPSALQHFNVFLCNFCNLFNIQIMPITVTDYLDVVSSWCFWSEPTWAELKKRYEGRVQFQWKIALMDPSGLPTSREQEQWFYRRSGMMMRSPFMLKTDWYDPSLPEWLAPNCVAEAAKDFGFTDDRVRLALAHVALREGRKIGGWDVAAQTGAKRVESTPENCSRARDRRKSNSAVARRLPNSMQFRLHNVRRSESKL